MKAIAIIAFAAHVLPAVLAKCCRSSHLHKCDDGTDATPCCGTQKCNLFCCGCKGGKCRARGTSKLLLERDSADEAFALADSAGNGNLTINRKLPSCAKATNSVVGI